jgi:hypothetical protein
MTKMTKTKLRSAEEIEQDIVLDQGLIGNWEAHGSPTSHNWNRLINELYQGLKDLEKELAQAKRKEAKK